MKTRQQDWAGLVGEFEQSDLTQAAFARQRGVRVSALRYWLYKRRREDAPGIRLVPVGVTGAASGCFEARVAEVGLRFEVGTDPEYVARLLRALVQPC